MGRIFTSIKVGKRECWTLFDTRSARTFILDMKGGRLDMSRFPKVFDEFHVVGTEQLGMKVGHGARASWPALQSEGSLRGPGGPRSGRALEGIAVKTTDTSQTTAKAR